MDNLEFGININIGGNVNTASNQAAASLGKVGSAVERLGNQANDSLGNLLALQSSLFVLTKFATAFQQFGFGIAGGIGKAFLQGIESSAEFQQSLSQLRIAAGKSFELARSEVLRLSAATNLSTQQTIDIAQRLIGVGLTADQVFKKVKGATKSGLENVSAALSRLSPMERTRAINSIANAVSDINSLERLLNVGVPQSIKDAFAVAGTESEKFNVILKFLDSRFRDVFGAKGIGGDLLFNAQRAFQNLQELMQRAFLPIVEKITPAIAAIGDQLDTLRGDTKLLESLRIVFSGIGDALVTIITYAGQFLMWTIQMIEKYPQFFKYALIFGLIGGALIGLIGTILFAELSVALFSIAIGKLTGFLVANGIATGIWGAQLAILGRVLNVVSFGQLGYFWTQLVQVGVALKEAIFGTLAWDAALKTTLSSLGFIALRLLTIGAIFYTLFALPDFLDRFNNKLGTLANILQVVASIMGAIIGFFAGGPAGALLGGFGTFAALESVAPKRSTSAAPENLPSGTTASAIQQQKMLEDALRSASENAQNQPLEINNNLMLDGNLLSKAVNKINKNESERFNLSTIAP